MSRHVVAAIQARLGSTRLPGKVLLPILGEPMIGRIIERVRTARRVAEVVITTSDQASDDRLAQYANAQGIPCSRGPLDDLVERLWRAAALTQADVLVRVWGDCPCVDPEIIDRAVARLSAEDLDFCHTSTLTERTCPYGLDIEVYHRRLLDELRIATTDPFFREFPAEYVQKHHERLRTALICCDQPLSHLYVTVDYPEDLEAVRQIYARIYDSDKPFGYRDLARLLAAEPALGVGLGQLSRNIEYHQKREARQ